MKKKILSLLLFISPIVLLAQVNETEAKAAYILSEESYLVGEYATALNYLAKAEEKLGQTNSKLLFLKVQILSELYKNDKSYHEKVLETITAFQSDPEIKNFNREKVLEVYKIKMLIESKIEEELLVTNNLNNKIEELETNYEDYSFEGWPFGVGLENLKITHSDSLIFQNKLVYKSYQEDKILTAIYPANIKWAGIVPDMFYYNEKYERNGVFLILAKDGIVKGYQSVIYRQQHMFKREPYYSPEKKLDKANAEILQIVEDLKNKFGVPQEFERNNIRCFAWEVGNKRIQLSDRVRKVDIGWHALAILEIIQL